MPVDQSPQLNGTCCCTKLSENLSYFRIVHFKILRAFAILIFHVETYLIIFVHNRKLYKNIGRRHLPHSLKAASVVTPELTLAGLSLTKADLGKFELPKVVQQHA